MAEKKLNVDIEKSVDELESIAKRIGLDINKKEYSSLKRADNKSLPNKKLEKKLNLKETYSLLKMWKNIFNVFLIFSSLIFIVMIFTMFFYYKTEIQEREKIMQNISESYISDRVHPTSELDTVFFHLKNFTGIPEKDIQNFIIIKNKECTPDILCEYAGYIRKYDLSTVANEKILLDKNVINCYDRLDCISNFTYLEPSEEPFSRQIIRIEKDDNNKLNIYDENNVLIAKLEKEDSGYIKRLNIWFKF